MVRECEGSMRSEAGTDRSKKSGAWYVVADL